MGVEEQYARVAKELAAACAEAGRDPGDVCLVAVSKTVGPEEVGRALVAGALNFGENRPEGIAQKSFLYPQAKWHFIGNIQSRRIPEIVAHSNLIHSVFERRHLNKINEAASSFGKVQDVLLEVNISGEKSKGGLAPDDVLPLLELCTQLKNVRPRGLMTMAPQGSSTVARQTFAELALLHRNLRKSLGVHETTVFDGLSMGMSEDWREAVLEGATIVRVGRAIFSNTFEK